MKFAIVLAALIAFTHAAPSDIRAPSRCDFQMDFDYQVEESTVQRFRQFSDFLLKISDRVDTHCAPINKEMKDQILKEINDIEVFIKDASPMFERQLKRTDLSSFAKINYKVALAMGVVLSQELPVLAAQINHLNASMIAKD